MLKLKAQTISFWVAQRLFSVAPKHLLKFPSSYNRLRWTVSLKEQN